MTDRSPWFRLETETPTAYDAFQHYLFLPSTERSVARAWRDATGKTEAKGRGKNHASSHWEEYATQNRWVERSAAYDDHLTAQRFVFEQEAMISRARQKAARRDAIEDLEDDLSRELIRHAREMLKWPIAKKTVQDAYPDGRERIVILEPKKWTAVSITRFLDLADRLMRLSAGMHTDNTKLDVNSAVDGAVDFVLAAAERVLSGEAYEALARALKTSA